MEKRSRYSSVSGDLWGGLTAMLVALPAAIAFGVLIYSPLGPEYAAQGAMAGMLGAVAIGIMAPTFGGVPGMISAPCAPAAAMLSALVARWGEPASGIAAPSVLVLMALTALLSALLQVMYGQIGGGRLIKYIPYPVVSGYLSGVAVLIALAQLPKLFGLANGASLWLGLVSPGQWRWEGLVVGVATMAVMALTPHFTRRVPGPILGLLAGILSYLGLCLFLPELFSLERNPLLIGPIATATGSPLAALEERALALLDLDMAHWHLIVVPTLTLSVLLSIDTLKTGVVLDALIRQRSDSNRELRGQGLANLAAALTGGVPGSGTMGPTLMNVSNGGRTRLSGLVAGGLALAVLLALGRLIAWIPVSALAGVLLVVAFRMVDRHSFRLLRHQSTRLDFAVVAAVVVVAATAGLIAASGVGVGLAILLFIRDQMHGSIIRRKRYGNEIASKAQRLPIEREALHERGRQVVVAELQGSLFFGTTDQLISELIEDLQTRRFVILDLRRVQLVDYTAAHALDQIQAQLAEQDGLLLLSDLHPSLATGQDLESYLDDVGLTHASERIRIFDTLDDALEWMEERLLEEAALGLGEERVLELGDFDLFREAQPEMLMSLIGCVEEKSFATDEKVLSHQDQGDQIFLIRRGSVRILLPINSGKHFHLATFRQGDFFGEIGFLDPGKRSADAVAAGPTELYALSRELFNHVSRRYPELGVRVFARLARALAFRLGHADSQIRSLEEQ
ncbi:MAG: SLC26A/SulP transporter family protein [Candidatus Latescibacteria bacterium]|nr:SLC26A/SulP transporter family protein [Candidatus Latescibacterota bacterium]